VLPRPALYGANSGAKFPIGKSTYKSKGNTMSDLTSCSSAAQSLAATAIIALLLKTLIDKGALTTNDVEQILEGARGDLADEASVRAVGDARNMINEVIRPRIFGQV
jgi:hypothetical protein